jgi:hypothetical protein
MLKNANNSAITEAKGISTDFGSLEFYKFDMNV